jgi:sialate O-acetylesterase
LISLTFDDALVEHLEIAAPILDAYQLKGTFYVHLAARQFFQRRFQWSSMAEQGHELGGHTIFHPALASKDWVSPGIAIDDYSLDRMRHELTVANDYLASVDGLNERSFAYPCSNPHLGRAGYLRRVLPAFGLQRTRLASWVDRAGVDFGATKQSYQDLVSEFYFAARCGGLTLMETAPPATSMQRYLLASAAVDGHGFAMMSEFIERSLASGGWAILQFHGVGGGHSMNCQEEDFAQLIDWIASRYAEFVVTIRDGVKRLQSNGMRVRNTRVRL